MLQLVRWARIHPIRFTACTAANTASLGFKFGGQTYNFTGIDLILDDVSNTPGLDGMCLSSLFVLGSVLESDFFGNGGPAWLVGDAFLKSVYSVYRSVGIPSIHIITCSFKSAPDMRQPKQERTAVQLALPGLVVWTAVSQRMAYRCTRLRHLLRASIYQPPPVSLAVLLSLTAIV